MSNAPITHKGVLWGDDSNAKAQEETAVRIQNVLETLLRTAGIGGEIVVFGSFSNGFKTGGSDLDVVLCTKQKNQSDAVTTLNKIAGLAPKYNFTNITKIFQANVPILKFTDALDNMEIDFCINNLLGIRNSSLLQTYCRLDIRIPQLGRIIKSWAKRHEIVGTADGCLNSYAYMLLVIYFLQMTNPPLSVNLQALGTEAVPVIDYKWGAEGGDVWDTQFLSDCSTLPPVRNKQPLDELARDFFEFYLNLFDWKKDAVSMRIGERHVPKESLLCFAQNASSDNDQWCVEDPFDLKHNLAGKCTSTGKKRIMDEFAVAYRNASAGDWEPIINPKPKSQFYFLKCRVSGAVTPQAMLEEFEQFNLNKLYFPKITEVKVRFQQAFLEFATNEARRKAHTKNETYVADCQLQMHYTSQSALNDSLMHTQYSTYDMQSYKMQRQILEGESNPNRPNPNAASFYPGMQYEMGGPPGLGPGGIMGRPWEFDDERRRHEEVDLHEVRRAMARGEMMDLRGMNNLGMRDRRSPFQGHPGEQPLSAREKVGLGDPRIQQMMSMQQMPPHMGWGVRGAPSPPATQQQAQQQHQQLMMMKGMKGMDPGAMAQMGMPPGWGGKMPPQMGRKGDQTPPKREKGGPDYEKVLPSRRFNLETFKVNFKIPEALEWKEMQLLTTSDQPPADTKGKLFPARVHLESLKTFYGQFKNDALETWKRRKAAGAF